MKKKSVIIKLLLFSVFAFLFAGCAGKTDFDKDGEILQQIPCGKLMEPVTFSFIWNDLQIFSINTSEWRKT